MSSDRWTLALQDGSVELPAEGTVLVLRAHGMADYSEIGLERVRAVQGFFPEHAMLGARGVPVATTAEGSHVAALIHAVKSKVETLSMVAEAMALVAPGGPIMLDGQKTDGIESLLKHLRAVMPIDGVLSKAHGKLVWITRPDDIPPQIAGWRVPPEPNADGYITAPGMFSPDGADAGSQLLSALAPQMAGRVADLGAGWGYLAATLLPEQPEITGMDLIEAEWSALEAARLNVTDPRANFLWDDATTYAPADRYDAVISNPPFHTGRKAQPELGRAFIATAARILKPTGAFVMVANRHLPYEDALKDHFGSGEMLAEIGGYKLYRATKPLGPKRRKLR